MENKQNKYRYSQPERQSSFLEVLTGEVVYIEELLVHESLLEYNNDYRNNYTYKLE